jgi:hypothetical protein
MFDSFMACGKELESSEEHREAKEVSVLFIFELEEILC